MQVLGRSVLNHGEVAVHTAEPSLDASTIMPCRSKVTHFRSFYFVCELSIQNMRKFAPYENFPLYGTCRTPQKKHCLGLYLDSRGVSYQKEALEVKLW